MSRGKSATATLPAEAAKKLTSVQVVDDDRPVAGLPAKTLRRCHAEPAASVEQAVADCLAEYGPRARVAVIPKGPYVLPYVA